MHKYLFSLSIVFVMMLSACSTQNTAQPTGVPTVAPTIGTTTQPTLGPTPTPAPYTDDKTPCKPLSIINDVLLSSPIPNLTPVTASDWTKGPADAKVTFIVYTDLQCPYCAQLEPILNDVLKAHPNDLRLVERLWPLSIHDKALLAGQAAEAAGKQGKFFDLADLLFTNQAEWSTKSSADFETYLKDKVTSLGLNVDQFLKDFKDPAIVQKVKADQDFGNSSGFQGTPTLIINGSLYEGPRSTETLSKVIDYINNKGTEYQCPPSNVIDVNKSYTATIKTNKGDIVIELLPKVAPETVKSFVYLAQNNWFDNNAFFAVQDNFVITGDKTNTSIGGPGYAFKDEISSTLKFDKEGMVGMYNLGPGSGTNGSQFFITKNAMSAIDGQYTIFGMVTQGMDVVKALTQYDSTKGIDSADKILSVTITTQ